MVCPYREILFSNKKEWSVDTCNNMNKPWKCNKWQKAVTKGHVTWFIYKKYSECANLQKQKDNVCFPGVGEEAEYKQLLTSKAFPFGVTENILKLYIDDRMRFFEPTINWYKPENAEFYGIWITSQ